MSIKLDIYPEEHILYYIIYKTTNLINSKFYIGKHQTKNLDDGYKGSGKYLKRAIKKYGKDNFVTQILYVYDNEKQMNLAEKILVVPDIEISYNLCSGGQGGFGYINKNTSVDEYSSRGKKGGLVHKQKLSKNKDYELNHKNKMSVSFKIRQDILVALRKEKHPKGVFYNKKHTEETRLKTSLSMKNKGLGKENSQYGTIWITNGINNKKIMKNDLDKYTELGYYKGRI